MAEKQTAQELIQANIQVLIQQMSEGKSDGLLAYLAAMGKFHNYSFGNIMAIAMQRPDATRVAGFHAWIGLGRCVKKGEKGIRILAPMVAKRKDDKKTRPEDVGKPFIMGFRNVYVFDISQTEGKELPSLSAEVTGEVGDYRDRLNAFATGRGIVVSYNPSIAPAYGLSYGGRIELLPEQPAADEFATLVHELAHELLHKKDRSTSKMQREAEAEAVSFAICSSIGLDAGSTSADYIALYNGNAEVLLESMTAIQSAAGEILSAITTKALEEESEAA